MYACTRESGTMMIKMHRIENDIVIVEKVRDRTSKKRKERLVIKKTG